MRPLRREQQGISPVGPERGGHGARDAALALRRRQLFEHALPVYQRTRLLLTLDGLCQALNVVCLAVGDVFAKPNLSALEQRERTQRVGLHAPGCRLRVDEHLGDAHGRLGEFGIPRRKP